MKMRKFVLALAGLLVSATAQAHVSAVPFPEVGSLQDAHKAAFSIVQTYLPAPNPQIFYNIITDGGATCNGDKQTVTLTVSTPPPFSPLVTVFSNQFSGADVGKAIKIPGVGNSGGDYSGVISAVGAFNGTSQVVTVSPNTGTQVTSASKSVTFGSNDAPAFAAFNVWARANQGSTNQVVLTIPNGSNCWFGAGSTISGYATNFWAAGIKNLIVEGTGATIDSVDGSGFQLGATGTCFQGLTATPGCSARLQDITAGANTVTLTAASFSAGYISRFSVGKRVLIGGIDPQAGFGDGGYGDPVNLWAFEWRTITAICNNTGACPGAAVITLDTPLVDAYSASWPQYNDGDQFHSDGGGPASIWALNDGWETTVEYRGLTISQPGQTYAQGRNITYRDVTFTGAHGGIPTQNETFSAINTNYGFTNMETDKLVTTMLFDGVTIAKVVNQSTATKRLIIRNSTFTIGLDGGAQYTEITDTDVRNWAPGIWVYGSLRLNDTTTCTRCTINAINYTFGPTSQSDYNYYTKSGSTITMPNAGAQGSGPGQRYFVPGALVYYSTSNTNPPITFSCCESIGSFQVTTITSDPWPSVTDNQTLTTTVNITSGTKALNVPSGPFVSGDVNKTIVIAGAGNSGGNLYTIITGFTSATDVTLYNAAGTSVSSSKTIQWGTSNTYIGTNQASAFPSTTAFNSAGSLYLKTTGTPNITCDVCNAGNPTSDGYAISLQAGATAAKPLGSYVSKQYTPTSAQGTLGAANARGIFKGMSINVTTAATSAGAVTMSPVGQFQTNSLISQNTPGAPAPVTWTAGNFSINLKQTGNRAISASGVVTCNGSPGACAGDTINPPANMSTMWLPFGAFNPYMGSTHTGAPTFTITIQADPIQ